jgi:hypothetical protein
MGSGRGHNGGECHPAEARKGRPVFYQGMASSTRTKTPQRGSKSKSKSGRRLPPKVKSGPDIPVLAVVVGVILLLVGAGLVVYAAVNNRPATVPSAAGIPCDQLEHTQVHYHVALQIMHEGVLTPIPGGIGIQGGEAAPSCYYWLHVHSANQDVIHIESPAKDTFTLGDFFAVWNTWSVNNGRGSEPLDATHVSSFTLTPDEKIYVYLDANDGKGAQLFTGDPKTIPLKAHEIITIEIASGKATTPPPFNWSSSANNGL